MPSSTLMISLIVLSAYEEKLDFSITFVSPVRNIHRLSRLRTSYIVHIIYSSHFGMLSVFPQGLA